MSVLLFIGAIVLIIFAVKLHKSADKIEKSSSEGHGEYKLPSGISIDTPDKYKPVYNVMTKEQKLASMRLMWLFGGTITPTPEAIQRVNLIMAFEGKAMGISREDLDKYEHNDIRELSQTIQSISSKAATDSLLLAFFNIIQLGKEESALFILLKIYEGLGYSEEECIDIIRKDQTKGAEMLREMGNPHNL